MTEEEEALRGHDEDCWLDAGGAVNCVCPEDDDYDDYDDGSLAYEGYW